MPALPQLIVFSGAGLSAESGLQTFRGDNGLWEGVPLDVVCNYHTWQRNFDAVHAFYDARRKAGMHAKPNAGHRAIATWQKRWPGRVRILTQNVDHLLESAGCTDVVHLHGDARLLHCVDCDKEWEISGPVYDHSGCSHCGQKQTVKPGIIFFGQDAPQYEVLHQVVAGLRMQDTAVVVGTSGVVLPADQLFGYSPAHSVLVNLEPGHDMDEATFTERHYGPATQELPKLTTLLEQRMNTAG